MKKLLVLAGCMLLFFGLNAQNIGMNATGASADPSAMLDISSTTSGLLVPRMTTAQRTAIISPATSLIVFDITLNGFYFFNGVSWQPFTSSSTGWNILGNTGTTAATNFIGTTDAVDFVTRTNNTEKMRVTSAGNVGIGNSSPNAALQFASVVANRKIVLFESVNNDHQFLGFGINGSILRYQVDQASANHVFYAGAGAAASTELMRIQGNGDVGIGTSAPTAKLEVNGTFRITDGTQGAGKVLTSDATGLASWATVGGTLSGGTTNYLPKWTSATTLSSTSLVFDNGSAVGIGTTGPTQLLDVQGGNARINNSFVGDFGFGWAGFAHASQASGTGYALGETADGAFTLINKANTGNGFIGFRIGNVDAAVITNAGNMGIGTIAPVYKLDISGSQNNLRLSATAVNDFPRMFFTSGHATYGGVINREAAKDLYFGETSDAGRFIFRGAGGVSVETKLGIGTAAPGGQLELSLDQGRKPGTATWTIVSDERLKNINGEYTKGLDAVLQLNTITYNYKNAGERVFDERVLQTTQVGFSAQEVQKIFPEAVGTDEDGFLNLNMHAILVAYTNAIKELDQKIEEQEKLNAELKARLDKLELLLEKK